MYRASPDSDSSPDSSPLFAGLGLGSDSEHKMTRLGSDSGTKGLGLVAESFSSPVQSNMRSNILSKKYQLHIITNGFKEVQFLKLERSNIKGYFKTIVTSECVGVKKPNAKIFEYALQKANATVENSLMIGDSYEADVLGAFNFGIKPIYLDIDKNKSKEEGIITINALKELKQYL